MIAKVRRWRVDPYNGDMKIAIVYNRASKNVINLFGQPNKEKYGLKSISRILDALKTGGHQVIALEGDKNLVERLEDFMPRVLKGERPGMVFNLSYGIQGQARYTHIPGMLEMLGIPYVGSGPLGHSLALDKVVSKMIFKQHGLPTPDFAVLEDPDFEVPDLPFPLIVKPKDEAVSFGIRIVNDEAELRAAAATIFEAFNKPVLAERYIDGREVNVGLLGNSPTEALPPAEVIFGPGGPAIYTHADKTRRSGREIRVACPADLEPGMAERASDLAKKAFAALGLFDCARVDMRLDHEGRLYILEINSLPSLGEHGSYVEAARASGLDFPALVNRLVEVASGRYFGTPHPPQIVAGETDPGARMFSFLTSNRDAMEKRLAEWVAESSRTHDPTGIRSAVRQLDQKLQEIRLRPVPALGDERSVWVWQSPAGLAGGTLLVGHLDVPLDPSAPIQMFRREPESLFGEGIGSSRAPLVMLEFALRALRQERLLRKVPLGVLYYLDEGRECRYSAERIAAAAAKARDVLVLRPGNPGDQVIFRRRGHRKYLLTVEGMARGIGWHGKRPEALRWTAALVEQLSRLSSRAARLSVSFTRLDTTAFPLRLPHRAEASLVVTYPNDKAAQEVEAEIRARIADAPHRVRLELVSDRPPMRERRKNRRLFNELTQVAKQWEIPLGQESSTWPSVAGLVPASAAVLCGVGPICTDLYTPHESIQRISLIQRTLLLAQHLGRKAGQAKALA